MDSLYSAIKGEKIEDIINAEMNQSWSSMRSKGCREQFCAGVKVISFLVNVALTTISSNKKQ